MAGLLAEEGALRRAAPGLSAAERSALLRPGHPDAWTVADVPLLDEAAQLLGTDDTADKRRRRALDRERRAEERYAREVLEITPVGNEAFGGSTRLADLVDASTLADWNRDPGQQLTTAERAWADPSWAYGHVIVDEAQELSAMAWRMVMRRIPTRSMTVVGDVAQRGSAAGARSWAQMLDPYVKGRWREELLTVNYRTPTEIMALAADVLAAVAPDERPPESVREEGVAPRAVQGLAAVPGVVKEELAEMGPSGRRTAGRHRAGKPDRRAGPGAARGGARRPGRGARLPGRAADRGPGQGPRVRPRGAGRPGRDPGPVAGRRPRPVRRDHPRHPPPHRRPRRPLPPPSPASPKPPARDTATPPPTPTP